MDSPKQIPRRRNVPHEIPLWIDPTKEIYFITICAESRGKNHLAWPVIADQLFETFTHRNQAGVWFVHFGLLMPDDVHLLASFPQSDKRVQTVVSKRITLGRVRYERDSSLKLKTGRSFSWAICAGKNAAARYPFPTPQRRRDRERVAVFEHCL